MLKFQIRSTLFASIAYTDIFARCKIDVSNSAHPREFYLRPFSGVFPFFGPPGHVYMYIGTLRIACTLWRPLYYVYTLIHTAESRLKIFIQEISGKNNQPGFFFFSSYIYLPSILDMSEAAISGCRKLYDRGFYVVQPSCPI